MTTILEPVLIPLTTEAVILEEWLDDLTNPEINQVRGSLKGSMEESKEKVSGYCCLGVLAHGISVRHPDWLKEHNFAVEERDNGMTVQDLTQDGKEEACCTNTALPVRLVRELGMRENDPLDDDGSATCVSLPISVKGAVPFNKTSLAGLNDAARKTFLEIREVIIEHVMPV